MYTVLTRAHWLHIMRIRYSSVDELRRILFGMVQVVNFTMGMRLSGSGKRRNHHRAIQEMASCQTVIGRRLRWFMSIDIIMD